MKSKKLILTLGSKPSYSLSISIIKSESSKNPELNPKGYFWEFNRLFHDGSKLKKKREVNTSIDLNKEFSRLVKDIDDVEDVNFIGLEINKDDEVWKPLIISTRRKTDIDLEDIEIFRNRFMVSQYGNINSVPGFDSSVGHIYWHKNDSDFHVTIKTKIDGVMVSRNQGIASLVEHAFSKEESEKIRNIIQTIRKKLNI